MARGLEKILEKIGENPRQTLIGRYLSLIADIKDEDDRASHALALAEQLVGTKTDDALRIAYMVYESGRHLTRALKIVIQCFEDKGRAGKVAVLKLELEKLEKELQDETPEESRRRQKPLPDLSYGGEKSAGQFSLNNRSEVSSLFPVQPVNAKREDTRMAELDLGDLEQNDSSAEDAVDLLFPDHKDGRVVQGEDVSILPELDLAEGFLANLSGRPGDTVLPGLPAHFSAGKDDERSGTMVSRVIPKEQMQGQYRAHDIPRPPVQTVKLEDIPRISLDGPSRVSGFVAPSEPRQARGAAPSEIFDRFFAAGKLAEAEVVLESSRADSHFEWWRSRRERLDKELLAAKAVVSEVSRPAAPPAFAGQGPVTYTVPTLPVLHLTAEKTAATREPAGKPFSGDFRKGVTTEILRIADRLTRQTSLDEKDLVLETRGNMRDRIPDAMMRRLLSQPLETPGEIQLFFDLLQGISAGRGGDDLLSLMEKRDLRRSSPAWFGFYLDTLLNCGFARKALAESVLLANQHQGLTWIRVIWHRLPQIWDQLGTEGFLWSEEDGTKEFVAQIKKRPKPLLKQFL